MDDPNKKIHKKPKNKNLTSINLETSKAGSSRKALKPQCPLLAKDSEWVDILQSTSNSLTSSEQNDEEVLQIMDTEDESQMRPLGLMFPGLLESEPDILERVLNKVMSTTEVTKHLVGQKANFSFMRKVNRLIPPDKKWLESLPENSTSTFSMESKLQNNDDRNKE